jgi:hypothetical protein
MQSYIVGAYLNHKIPNLLLVGKREKTAFPTATSLGVRKDMTKKRPIERLRDGAVSLEVKTPDDDSAITGMITFGDRLLVVKEKGIYEIKLADQIDPERKNIQVPNTVQRVLPYGSNEPWVGAVLLTGHELLKKEILNEQIDVDSL